MRNRFPGWCYRCGRWVAAGDGHFEKLGSRWRVQHANCAIQYRGTPDPERTAWQIAKWQRNAAATGRRGQRARKNLRDRGLA